MSSPKANEVKVITNDHKRVTTIAPTDLKNNVMFKKITKTKKEIANHKHIACPSTNTSKCQLCQV